MAAARFVEAWPSATPRTSATRFAEEARRIHYGESEATASAARPRREEREALRDEGIEVFTLPLPDAVKAPLQ